MAEDSVEHKCRPPDETAAPPPPLAEETAARGTTRRGFLQGAATKAVYVTPIVMTLTASQARAGSAADFDSTCGEEGSPCTDAFDCCCGDCMGGNCNEMGEGDPGNGPCA